MTFRIKVLCLKSIPIACFLLFWLPVHSQDFSAVETLFRQQSKTFGGNAAVIIWKDGKILYQKQFEKEAGDFGPKIQAPIMASANWLTAALVMTFVEQGKISLDDKVSKYIPDFEKYMKSYITIRNCLTETTGVQGDAGSVTRAVQKSKYASLEDEVNAYASKRDIVANPGMQFFYTNIGPNIVGRVLEIVSKKGFDRLMQERITRPLKMRGTTFYNEYGGAIDPSGGAKSTAGDYINFLSMLLNKGMFEGKQILAESSIEEIEKIQFPDLPVKFTPKSTEGWHYGLGTWIEETDSKGNSSVISCPNFEGTYPIIDKCRNYAAIFIVKSPVSEPKKEFFIQLKQIIDAQIPSTCQ